MGLCYTQVFVGEWCLPKPYARIELSQSMGEGPGFAPSRLNVIKKFERRSAYWFGETPLRTAMEHVGVEGDDGLLLR